VPPPYKPGKYLFGVHNVGVLRNQLSLYDVWMSSKAAIECVSAEYVLRTSEMMLSQISDEEYRTWCGSKEDLGELDRSKVWLVEQMEIVPIEHF